MTFLYSMEQTALLLIDGERIAADSGDTFVLINPHNSQPTATIADAGPTDIDRAVASSIAAFRHWSALSAADRCKKIFNLLKLLKDNAEELARLDSLCVGKPLAIARLEVETATRYLAYYGKRATQKNLFQQKGPKNRRYSIEPFGVCGMIMSWDFPLLATVRHCAPALAMGNSVLIKPALRTPLSALLFGELTLRAGLPRGTVNVITGRGSTAGESLVRHPMVPRITFRGSTTTGKEVLEKGAYNLKRITMDLSGKSAAILLPDADLDSATASVVDNIIRNAGQNPRAKSRLLVTHKQYAEVIERLVKRLQSVRIGNPLDPQTDMGPLISRRQQERILKYIELGRSAGATLLFGGRLPADGALANGFYIEPTLFGDVEPQMYIAREEICGPVLCVIRYSTLQEAISIVNDSIYGIAASIWTSDIDQAMTISRQLDVGSVTINNDCPPPPDCPVSQRKHSGIGDTNGPDALLAYAQRKSILM